MKHGTTPIETAYLGGRILTLDPANPIAQAIACTDGYIVAVGTDTDILALCDPQTEIIPLEGDFVVPGRMDAHRTAILNVFEDQYWKIDPVWDLDSILEEGEIYLEEGPGGTVFGYGFDPHVLEDYPAPDDRQSLLDQITDRRPVALLGRDGITLWTNGYAASLLQQHQEAQGLDRLSTDDALTFLVDIDPLDIARAFQDLTGAAAANGFTALSSYGTPDIFRRLLSEALYQHPDQAMFPQMRILDSRFLCGEGEETPYLGDAGPSGLWEPTMVDFLLVDSDALTYLAEGRFAALAMEAAQDGKAVHVEAMDLPSVRLACQAFESIREAGYGDTPLILATDCPLQSLAGEYPHWDTFACTWVTSEFDNRMVSMAQTTEEVYRFATVEGAKLFGLAAQAGQIKVGYRADFARYGQDPYSYALTDLASVYAEQTIISGEVAFDWEEMNHKADYDMMMKGQLI